MISVKTGDVHDFVGKNGAGKYILMKIITSNVNTLVVNAFNKGMSDYKKGAKKSVIKYKVGRTLYWLKQIIRLFDKKRDERIWDMKWILRKP